MALRYGLSRLGEIYVGFNPLSAFSSNWSKTGTSSLNFSLAQFRSDKLASMEINNDTVFDMGHETECAAVRI
jgi:hypothetical protein